MSDSEPNRFNHASAGDSAPSSRWRPRGRPVFGLLAGLLTGFLVTVDLLLASLVPLEHQLVVIITPVVGLVGLVGGWWAPVRRRRRGDAEQLEMEIEVDRVRPPTESGIR